MNAGAGEPIQYYVKQIDQLKADEVSTMYVDWNHLSSFNWEDPLFLDKLISEYGRFEPYLRMALTNFLAENEFQIQNTWY